jgi:hypothetical protein
MIKTFTSYHHRLDQDYKEAFVHWAEGCGLIQDMSVGVGEIDELLEPQAIRRRIRDFYLKDTEVTVLLCGAETRFRKHIDWELKSSMIDGIVNHRSGILVINLPSSGSDHWYKAYGGEEDVVYPDYTGNWITIESKAEHETRMPNMPKRIIDNLVNPGTKISIVPWDRVFNHPDRLKFLLENARDFGSKSEYDLTRKMRMRDFNPSTDQFDFREQRR